MRHLTQALGSNRRSTHVKHATCIAVVTVLNDGDIDINNIACF